jgi:hypothetical protein
MVEKPIKVDEHTDRLVTDLAYFLRCSKKSVVRDAVADFAEARLPRSRTAPGVFGEYAPGRVGEGEEKGQRVRGHEALEDGTPEDGTSEDGTSDDSTSDDSTSDDSTSEDSTSEDSTSEDSTSEDGTPEDGAFTGDRDHSAFTGDREHGAFTGDRHHGGGSSRTGGMTFDALEPLDRLALRRTELLRQFAQHGGANVRVLERADESTTTEIVLLADTDPVAGSAAVPVLEEIAFRLLRTHVTVVSMTALRMFGSGRLQPALARSRAL